MGPRVIFRVVTVWFGIEFHITITATPETISTVDTFLTALVEGVIFSPNAPLHTTATSVL